MKTYRGLLSSDWSECLSPNGPFDFMSFIYPHLTWELSVIFRRYTGNEISLSEAMRCCRDRLPALPSADQMDAYLDRRFAPYTGVSELIEACLSRGILFMINTTGSLGYFQRVFYKKLLPRVSALSAHPGLRFSASKSDPEILFDLQEITDKPANTALVARRFQIPPQNILVMGDSGGDGPHFKWAAEQKAFRVASMAKPSLKSFCARQRIEIDAYFGISYQNMEPRREAEEMLVDFRDLVPIIDGWLGNQH